MSYYKPNRQPLIVVVCCTFHNWIHLSTWDDQLFRKYVVKNLSIQDEKEGIGSISHSINLSNENAITMTAYKFHVI